MKKLAKSLFVSFCCLFLLCTVSIAQATLLKDIYDIISDIEEKLKTRYDDKLAKYKRELENWINFSPPSISHGTVTIRPLDRLDLEYGKISGVPYDSNKWDLIFGNGPGGKEYLRALAGVSWFDRGVNDFASIKYRDIRDANYSALSNPMSGYADLFNLHLSNVPNNDYIFFIKTAENNLAKVQIVGYENIMSNNQVAGRNMIIRYEVFPVVGDPPEPKKPKSFLKN